VFSLAEGPLWDPARQRVLWVDILAGTAYEGRLEAADGTPGRVVPTTSHQLDAMVGAVVVSADGDLLAAGEHGLIVKTAGGDVLPGTDLLRAGSRQRLNDGKVDPAGRFLVGSLDRDGAPDREILVRVEPDGLVTVLDDDLTLSNGLAWSPDGSLMYSIDSGPGNVWVRDYDATTGGTGERRLVTRVTDGDPDGMCTDSEGFLWVAVYGQGQVRRFTPDGELAGVIEVDAPHTTCIAFVGDSYDRALITTATDGMSEAELARYPDAGRLFLVDVGVSGFPVTPWAGR